MTMSEKPSFVLRKRSLVIRQILMPAMACSTRTRVRARVRLWRFWPDVNSARFGFFSVADVPAQVADSRKTPDHCATWWPADTGCSPNRPRLCHVPRLAGLGSDNSHVYCTSAPVRCSCQCAISSCRCNAAPAFCSLSGGAVDAPRRPRSNLAIQPDGTPVALG